MLNSITIKNIALIDSLEVEFSKGLNVLSGETGAGKSIIIDSINFVLGKRADKTLIRYGENQATVTAIFDIVNCQKAKDILNKFDIDIDDELYIKRTMTIDGKNSCNINGQKVTLAMLKELTSTLVDIYGQNDSNFILNPASHLDILDEYGTNKISELKEKQQRLYAEYKDICKKLKEYGSFSNLAKNLDLYDYQIKEIEDANIKEGEEEELMAIRHKMNNSQFFVESLSASFEYLNGTQSDISVISLLNNAISQLNKVSEYDEKLEELISRLDSAKIDIKDVSDTLEEIANDSEFDSQKLAKIEERISLIRLIKRKYGQSLDEINIYLNQIKEKYEFLQGGEEKLKDLEIDKENIVKDLYENAKLLSLARKEVANNLSKKIEKELNELGMKDAKFVAKFNQFPIFNEALDVSANGLDEMEFMFSANKGQPERELTKIISGGELSRFTLALKNTIANLDGINTMIFDEIDSGISGHIAQVVAEKLYSISKDKQVLAITHLPQLAAMADVNYLIEKSSDDVTTKTSLKVLADASLVNEIIRLIGGKTSDVYAKPHAIEMISNAKKIKEYI